MTLFLKNNFADYQFINSYYLRKSVGDLCGKLSSPLLDIGCGSRPYDSFFAGIKKVNCDVVQTRGDVDVLCAAYPLPFGNNTFSSVLCTEVLEHVSNPSRAFQEIARVLSSRGRALISAPCWWPPHELPHDYFRFPEHGLRHLAESNGFVVLQLIPRGGLYAFFGQMVVLLWAQYFRFRTQRVLWNKLALKIDTWRKNQSVSLGWTILVEKNC